MRLRYMLAVAAVFLSAPASAQAPQLQKPQCVPQVKAMNKAQMQLFKRLQGFAKKEARAVCAQIEVADILELDKLIEPGKLGKVMPPAARELAEALGFDPEKVDLKKAMKLLGIEIDTSQLKLGELKKQCASAQANAEQFISSEIMRLEKDLSLCDDAI